MKTRTGEVSRPPRPTASVDPAVREYAGRSNAGARPVGLALAPSPAPEAEAGGVDSGDDADLQSVYLRHATRVSRWVARLAGPGFDVEDMVHDVFLVVQRRLGEFHGSARISTWLYEIAVRVVQARRRNRRRRRWMWSFRTETDRAATDEIPDQHATPLEALERRQATVLLYRFLDDLDEKYRTAVVLFELEGMPCQDIAAITGTSVSNVWARVSRGREKLIQAFAKWEARKAT